MIRLVLRPDDGIVGSINRTVLPVIERLAVADHLTHFGAYRQTCRRTKRTPVFAISRTVQVDLITVRTDHQEVST